ncbi:hypothetical protein [Bacillus sp. FJAT-52991]|uniref:Uncharacterized protein n=1 Tax=Bacillus kandeliae TaxID=3129297 RepID=A0ABZ2NBC4_9BACI
MRLSSKEVGKLVGSIEAGYAGSSAVAYVVYRMVPKAWYSLFTAVSISALKIADRVGKPGITLYVYYTRPIYFLP